MANGFENDPHSERGHACPRNRFGIVDNAELALFEKRYTIQRTIELGARGENGCFDTAHLRAIHQYIFQDVFSWAGQFREVNISKGSSSFGPARFLAGALEDVLEKLKQERFLTNLQVATFTQRAAHYLGELNAIHPFREGNGRTQREFIRQLAVHAGHPLSWAGFTQKEMVAASILAHANGDCSALASILSRAIEQAK